MALLGIIRLTSLRQKLTGNNDLRYTMLRLPHGVKNVFQEWPEAEFPGEARPDFGRGAGGARREAEGERIRDADAGRGADDAGDLERFNLMWRRSS
jgi:hypothetical protein